MAGKRCLSELGEAGWAQGLLEKPRGAASHHWAGLLVLAHSVQPLPPPPLATSTPHEAFGPVATGRLGGAAASLGAAPSCVAALAAPPPPCSHYPRGLGGRGVLRGGAIWTAPSRISLRWAHCGVFASRAPSTAFGMRGKDL